jgi:hypothetical protein
MKMYGLGLTSRGYLIVRDHRSRGEPCFFWRHCLKGKGKEEEKWNVATGSDGDGIGWVLRLPRDLGLEDDVGINPDELGVVNNVDDASSTSNLCKETLQTCLGIVGVDDCPKLIAAVKKYKDHEETMLKVLESEAKLAVATEEHNNSVRKYEELNPALQALITSSTGKDPSIGGSFKRPFNRPGKNRRKRKFSNSKAEESGTSSFCSSMRVKR